MFASQLMRIIQTIPSDVSVYDSAEQDMTMKENQNEVLHSSMSLGRGTDPLTFGSKEVYQCNGLRKDAHTSLFEVQSRDECWNPKFVGDLSMANQNGTRDSAFQTGLLYGLSNPEEDAYFLSSDPNAKDKMQSSPEHECSVAVEEFVHCKENESRDFRSPYIGPSDLFEKDNNLFTDKVVLECELPELMVCCKETTYYVVKDICIDEGKPVNSKILDDSSKIQSDHSFPQPLNDDSHCKDTGAADKKLFMSDGLSAKSLENTEGVFTIEHWGKEESNGILLSQGMPKSSSESSSDKDTSVECDPEDSMQEGGTISGATSRTINHASGESLVDKTLPIQGFGMRSFLRSFLNSLDGEENKVKLLPDQISSGKIVSEVPLASSAEEASEDARPKEDVQASSLYYNSKVETGSITFNFSSLAPVECTHTNGGTENVKQHSVDSRGVLDHKGSDADNLSDARLVHCNSSKDRSTGNIHEQSLYIRDRISTDYSASSRAQCVSKDMGSENSHDQSVDDHKSVKSADLKSSGLIQFANRKCVNSISSDGQVIESHVLKHEHWDPDNDSVVSLGKYDEGESSFSAAGLITYSGPISCSGSLSLRSDGSAASGGSFAFPVLQSECISSPVRMTKADGEHFRKHKGWRSGLLCCRF